MYIKYYILYLGQDSGGSLFWAGALMVMVMLILHLFQPHQADQMFDPDTQRCR